MVSIIYFLTSTTQLYFIDVLWMILTSRCLQNVCSAPLQLSLQYNQISYHLSVPEPFFHYVITVTLYHVFSPLKKNRLLPALPYHNEDFFWN